MPIQTEIKTSVASREWRRSRTGQVGPGRRLCWSTGRPPTTRDGARCCPTYHWSHT